MKVLTNYEHYFICFDCAAARGWTPREMVETMHLGTCPDCGEEKTLCPVRAFDKTREEDTGNE